MTGVFLINPHKRVCSCDEINVTALMMSLVSQQPLQPSLNHWAWMILSILLLEHLSQWAVSWSGGGCLKISYPLIKAGLCLIYQSVSLSNGDREADPDWFPLIKVPLWVPLNPFISHMIYGEELPRLDGRRPLIIYGCKVSVGYVYVYLFRCIRMSDRDKELVLMLESNN